MKNSDSGNVLFLILIAVALFAALSYAVTSSGRTNDGGLGKEKEKISQAEMDSYMASINQGTMRLNIINRCTSIDYTPPASQVAGDKSCHLFHPEGGGVVWRDMGLDACDLGDGLTSLAIGESCGSTVYAGMSGGNRIYTTSADSINYAYSTSTVATGANSASDGLANTNILVARAESYPAAELCRAIGPEWYLPAPNELLVLYANRAAIGGFDTSGSNLSGYVSSQEFSSSIAMTVRFTDGTLQTLSKTFANKSTRCVRRD